MKAVLTALSPLLLCGDTLSAPQDGIDYLAGGRPLKTMHLANALDAWPKQTGAMLPTPTPGFNEMWWRPPESTQ